MNGPETLIDAIERSLFAAGTVTGRIDVDDSRLAGNEDRRKLLLESYVQSGLIALVAKTDDSGELVAIAGDEKLVLDTSDANAVIAAVRQLLVRAGILLASGKAGAL